MKLVLIVLPPVTTSTQKDDIRSKTANDSYRSNYDATFGKAQQKTLN